LLSFALPARSVRRACNKSLSATFSQNPTFAPWKNF
jgi:hypothetical protein